MRVVQVHAAAARDGDQRVGLGGLAIELHRLEVQARQRADHFEMAQLLGADVHQQVLARGVLAVESLDRILHGRRQLAVRAAELLQEHVAERRVRAVRRRTVYISFFTW